VIELIILLDFIYWFGNRKNLNKKIVHFEYGVIFITYLGLYFYILFYQLHFSKSDNNVHNIDMITFFYGIYFFIQSVYYFFIQKRLTKKIIIISIVPYIFVFITALSFMDEIFGQSRSF
jgi:hypothetical protein